MAQNKDANTKNMIESRAEALSAILESLAPGSAEDPSNGTKLSTDQVRQLSEKLGQILGDQAAEGDGTKRNEKGELVNEEGLPIIEITEPVTPADYAFRPSPTGNFDDPDLLPPWALSPAEKARRKAERERILDLLEEEERAQEQQDSAAARQRLQDELAKRKEAAKTEMESLKRARELQKKMGRALIRSVVESRDKEEQEKAKLVEQEKHTLDGKVPKPKKSVSFADDVDENGKIVTNDTKEPVELGDVSLGTLRAKSGASHDRYDRQPMKLHVVERHPRGLHPDQLKPDRDSDDESDHDESADVNDDSDGAAQTPSDSEDSEDLSGDEEPSEWNDDDFDFAQHQREIALEYYKKRKTLGAEASSAMRAHTHGDHEWDQPEVPLEATLASTPPKPTVSRFKADRSAHPPPETGSLASHSLASTIVPLSHSSTMKRALRMGKLENDKLVGGKEGDSEDEVIAEDENTRAMLEMLKRGEVTNIGPSTLSALSDEPAPAASASSPSGPIAPEEGSIEKPKSSKVSKFKLSMTQPESGQLSPDQQSSALQTPISIVDRSSPKMLSPREPMSRQASETHGSSSKPPTFTVPDSIRASLPDGQVPTQMPSMIVESPSFRPPQAAPRSGQMSLSLNQSGLRSPLTPTSANSVSSTSTAVGTPVSATTSSLATPLFAESLPVAAMREAVVERRPPSIATTQSAQPDSAVRPRVSRFKAGRS